MAALMPPRISRRCVLAGVLLIAALAACGLWPRHQFSGRVVRILDGDTIEVLHGRRPERVRLYGVDCPERRQAFGTVARQFTGDTVFGKDVTVKVRDRDRYGRTVGEVILPSGSSLNYELVRAGLAWWYRDYAPADIALRQAEEEARRARRGLWSDPNAEPPWEFRRQSRKPAKRR
jgi:micrococcal nuclease